MKCQGFEKMNRFFVNQIILEDVRVDCHVFGKVSNNGKKTFSSETEKNTVIKVALMKLIGLNEHVARG